MLQKTLSDERFGRLFAPGHIGPLWIKNRVVKAPTETRFADSNGMVTQRLIDFYREIARGGVGLVMVEFAHVDERASRVQENQLSISRDEAIPGLEWLASTIKDNGAAACQQIVHAGLSKLSAQSPARAPSPVPWPAYIPVPPPVALTIEEIAEVVEAFGAAALRAKKAGFDMVEIHGAHGYLITNFLSPHFNKRTDAYGGPIANRMRFLLEVAARVRAKVGSDFPLSVRLSAVDHLVVEPITIEETKAVAVALENAGINAIHVSSGGHMAPGKDWSTHYSPPGSLVWAAAEIKSVVSVPVIAVRSITTPQLAEQVLREGKADFIALGRPLLADPHYPAKARDGRPEDIRPCIRCSEGCYDRGVYIGGVKCTVNPTIGQEGQVLSRVPRPRRVAVVGGGPAGIEAAIAAAARGHQVTLFEKKELGGMLIPASIPGFKADLRAYALYLVRRLEKAGVDIVIGEATAGILANDFDAVIVATGAVPWVPDIPGINKPLMARALDVLRGAKTGNRILVSGGGMIASDTALLLAEQGKQVTITTRGNAIARGLSARARVAFLDRLAKQHVTIVTGARLEAITDGGALIAPAQGQATEVAADTVIVSAGMVPDRRLFDDLAASGQIRDVYCVGDAVVPRTIFDAVHEGYAAGHNLA